MKTELKNNPFAAGYKILVVDDLQKNCPFQQPIPMPGKIQGSVQLFQQPCGTHCPHFHFNILPTNPPANNCFISCGGDHIFFDIDNIETEPEPSKGPKLVID